MSTRIWLLIVALVITIVPVGAAQPLSTSEILNQGIDFGDWKKTQSLYNQILKKDPNNADALIARARTNSLNGKTKEAIADCDKVLAKHPRFALALLIRGGILCSVGKTQAGNTDLKLYLTTTNSARDAETRSCRAFAFEYLKDYDSVRKVCQSIVNDTGSATSAVDIFNRGLAQIGLKKFKEGEETLTKLKSTNPVAPRLLSWLAYCHSENGDSALALKEFAEVAEQAPDYFSNQGAWGSALEKLKKYDEAIRHYDRALQIQDHYLFALRARGHCYYTQRNYSLSLKDFSKAIMIEPDDTYTILQRAYTYAALRQHKEAIDDATRVTTLEPKNAYAWCQLSCSLAELGKWKESLAASTQALKLKPNYENARYQHDSIVGKIRTTAEMTEAIRLDPNNAQLYFDRGLFYRDEAMYAKAIADLSAAIKINSSNALYYCARGCSEVRNHNYKEAIEDCNISIQLDPKREHPYLSRGEAYSAIGKYDLALRDLGKAIELHPTCIEAFTERAGVYKKLNKTHFAVLDLDKARQLTLAEQEASKRGSH
jgi:tetratricopeptide (TPR) repeat protein